MNKKNVIIFVKGVSMTSRRGFAAWASSLNYGDRQKLKSSASDNSTASEMECNAILHSIQALTLPCNLIVKTNLEYVANLVNNKTAENSSNPTWGVIFNEIETKHHTLNALWVPVRSIGYDAREFSKLKEIAHHEMELTRKAAVGYSFDLFDTGITF